MEQLQQRVLASRHLGPLDEAEKRANIEHGLRHVGWQCHPRFVDDAFAQIYRATGGIPRRVDRLCGRLVLGAYLAGRDDIAVEGVLQTLWELDAEIDEANAPVDDGVVSPVADGRVAGVASGPHASREVVARSGVRQRGAASYCVDSLTDCLKAGTLAKAFASYPAMPSLVAVQAGSFEELLDGLDDGESLPRRDVDIGLRLQAAVPTDRSPALVHAVARFWEVFSERRPAALIMSVASDVALLCGPLADRSGVPAIRSDVVRVLRNLPDAARSNAQTLDRLAGFVYTGNLVSYRALHKARVAQDRLQCVGDLVADVVHLAESRPPGTEDVLKAIGSAAQLRRGKGYGVVMFDFDPQSRSALRMERTTTALVKRTAVRPLSWLVDDAAIDAMGTTGVTPRPGRTDLVVLPRRRHFQVLGLLRQAELFVSVPNGPYLKEAVDFGLPCTSIDADGGISLTGVEPEQARAAHGVNELARLARELRTANSGITERSAAARDGGAARRITTHLGAWLFGRSSEHTGGDDAEGGVLGANT